MIPLGDAVELALSRVGITKERVEAWVGHPCGCEERKEKLNRLHRWVVRVLVGRTENAHRYLEEMLTEEDEVK